MGADRGNLETVSGADKYSEKELDIKNAAAVRDYGKLTAIAESEGGFQSDYLRGYACKSTSPF